MPKGSNQAASGGMANVDADEPGRFRLTYLLHGVAKSVEFSQPEVLIGRSSECDLVLNQPGMSRKHALIRRAGGGWIIVDQKSRNGTLCQPAACRATSHPRRRPNQPWARSVDSRLAYLS